MKSQQVAVLLAGLISGIVSVTIGRLWPAMLTVGVGPLFFISIVAGMAITGALHDHHIGLLQCLGALIVSTTTYVVGLLAFNVVSGFSPEWFGVQSSSDFLDFRFDVWLGLLAAAGVAASGITLLAALLTGHWSNYLLIHLMLAGLLTIGVTFAGNLPFHNYWSFFGILLPVGTALFCWLGGAQIWRNPEIASQMAGDNSRDGIVTSRPKA
jgi:hypothetical protein